MYIKHVFTAALTRWLHSVLVLARAIWSHQSWALRLILIWAGLGMAPGWDYACAISQGRGADRRPKIIQWLSLILLPESKPEVVKLKINAHALPFNPSLVKYLQNLIVLLLLCRCLSDCLQSPITGLWWLGCYSGGDKTSVESLGGDFSINNAFNPRNLGAKWKLLISRFQNSSWMLDLE